MQLSYRNGSIVGVFSSHVVAKISSDSLCESERLIKKCHWYEGYDSFHTCLWSGAQEDKAVSFFECLMWKCLWNVQHNSSHFGTHTKHNTIANVFWCPDVKVVPCFKVFLFDAWSAFDIELRKLQPRYVLSISTHSAPISWHPFIADWKKTFLRSFTGLHLLSLIW